MRWLKRLWHRLTHRPSKPIIVPSTVEDRNPSQPTSYKAFTIAIIKGHRADRPNATSYNGHREYFWNKLVQVFIFLKYKGKIRLITIERPKKKYKAAMKWIAQECSDNKVDLAIELHYDAAGVPKARGGHFRTKRGDSSSKRYALDFMRGYLSRFPFASQRHGGCVEMGSGDAGYWFCYYMDKKGIDSMLFEPFFSDYKTDESEPFLELDGYKLMAHYWIAEFDKIEAKLNL